MSTLPRPLDVLADKYRLEGELGRGGMGAVFRARHLVTGKVVAIKCQLPNEHGDADDMARFLAEARAAAAVSHPNIVDVYDVGEANGALFLVMEYLDGMPLAASLGHGPLPIGPAVRTMLGAMRGIQAAHRSGVVHRDLKPDNIFLRRDGDGTTLEPKVLDFGIAKLRAASNASAPSLTLSGTVMGTPHYMSPEQAEDSRRVDARADIYSIGVILYELLGGRRPFDGDSLTAVLLRAARGEYVPLRSLRPEVPPALAQAIAKAMAAQPADRFDRIGALMDALQPFAAAEGLQPFDGGDAQALAGAESSTPLAMESLSAPGGVRASRRRGLAVGVAALVLAAILFGLWTRARRDDRASETTAAAGSTNQATTARAAPAAATPPPPAAPSGTGLPVDANAGVSGASTEGAQPVSAPAAPQALPAASAATRERRTATRKAAELVPPSATPEPPSRSSTQTAAPPASDPPPQSEPPRRGRLRVDFAHDEF